MVKKTNIWLCKECLEKMFRMCMEFQKATNSRNVHFVRVFFALTKKLQIKINRKQFYFSTGIH